MEETKPKFPLLLKAAFGGGGRGQAVVEKEAVEDNGEALGQADFARDFEKCSKEAEMSHCLKERQLAVAQALDVRKFL